VCSTWHNNVADNVVCSRLTDSFQDIQTLYNAPKHCVLACKPNVDNLYQMTSLTTACMSTVMVGCSQADLSLQDPPSH
jgi:hypothetical protein